MNVEQHNMRSIERTPGLVLFGGSSGLAHLASSVETARRYPFGIETMQPDIGAQPEAMFGGNPTDRPIG